MKTAKQNTILYGIYGFLSVGAFFFLMKLFGLENITELRLVNVLILIVLTNLLARKNVRELTDFSYVQCLGSMIGANAITAILSSIGFLVYINVFDQDLLSSFKNHYIADGTFNVYVAAALIFFEGLAGGLAISFISMQYWKKYENQMS